VRVPPSAATIRRVIGRVCPGGLADLSGADPLGAQPLAVDGEGARGSRHGRSPAALLLAAKTGQGRTATQLRVPDKTNEITLPGEGEEVAQISAPQLRLEVAVVSAFLDGHLGPRVEAARRALLEETSAEQGRLVVYAGPRFLVREARSPTPSWCMSRSSPRWQPMPTGTQSRWPCSCGR